MGDSESESESESRTTSRKRKRTYHQTTTSSAPKRHTTTSSESTRFPVPDHVDVNTPGEKVRFGGKVVILPVTKSRKWLETQEGTRYLVTISRNISRLVGDSDSDRSRGSLSRRDTSVKLGDDPEIG